MRRLLWPCSICWIAHVLSYLSLVIFFLISFLVSGNEYVRSHRNIATVQDPEVAGEWVRLEGDIVSATEIVNIRHRYGYQYK